MTQWPLQVHVLKKDTCTGVIIYSGGTLQKFNLFLSHWYSITAQRHLHRFTLWGAFGKELTLWLLERETRKECPWVLSSYFLPQSSEEILLECAFDATTRLSSVFLYFVWVFSTFQVTSQTSALCFFHSCYDIRGWISCLPSNIFLNKAEKFALKNPYAEWPTCSEIASLTTSHLFRIELKL